MNMESLDRRNNVAACVISESRSAKEKLGFIGTLTFSIIDIRSHYQSIQNLPKPQKPEPNAQRLMQMINATERYKTFGATQKRRIYRDWTYIYFPDKNEGHLKGLH